MLRLPTRREFLQHSGCGLGSLALASLLRDERLSAAPSRNPLAPRAPHTKTARAKSVIFLFMAGGPSHMETFDPKPLLNRLNGKPRPKSFGDVKYQQIKPGSVLLGSRRRFKKHGESGIEVSDLFPELAERIDDITVIRSCYGDRGGALGGPVRVVQRARVAGISQHGIVDLLRAGIGKPFAAGLRRDA